MVSWAFHDGSSCVCVCVGGGGGGGGGGVDGAVHIDPGQLSL